MKTSILCLTVVCLFSNVGYAESMFSEEAVHACFTPAEDCTGYIVNAINEAKEEILVQAYSFTSTPIANALIDASNRHVTIKIILDKSQVMQKYSVTTLLNNNRLPVWIDSKVAIAHNKVIIIDKHLLLTGSFASFGKMILPEEEHYIQTTVQNALINKVPYQLMYHIKTSKNNEKLLFEHGQGVYDATEKVSELIGFISDITICTNYLINGSTKFSMSDCIEEITQLAYRLKLTSNKKIVISTREAEIAVYYCQGFSMKEIGIKLNISNRTAESHLNKIKSKLGCHTKSQLRHLFINTRAGRNIICGSLHSQIE